MTVSALQACLEKEIHLISEFLETLKAEATVLEDGATETALAATTAGKTAIADTLAQVAVERNTLLKALGYAENGPGLKAAADTHSALAALRQKLLNITEEARRLNDSNGRIIEVYLDHNQQTLDMLRQLVGGDIYDASGRKHLGGKGTSRNIKA